MGGTTFISNENKDDAGTKIEEKTAAAIVYQVRAYPPWAKNLRTRTCHLIVSSAQHSLPLRTAWLPTEPTHGSC